jgi:glycine/D-amino acid oxidase-like deaminating enzyme
MRLTTADVCEVLVNRISGWAEAKEALQATIEAAVGLGVTYVEAEITAVDFTNSGTGKRECQGVRTGSGDTISADRVVPCTGAYTPRLLVDSAPAWADLHAGGRIIAAGTTEGIAHLTTEQTEILKNQPVAINELPLERGKTPLPHAFHPSPARILVVGPKPGPMPAQFDVRASV